MNSREIKNLAVTEHTRTPEVKNFLTILNTKNGHEHRVTEDNCVFTCTCPIGTKAIETGVSFSCKHIKRASDFLESGGCLKKEDGFYCGERITQITPSGNLKWRFFHCSECREINKRKKKKGTERAKQLEEIENVK